MHAVFQDLHIDGIHWRSWYGELHYQLGIFPVTVRHGVGRNLHPIFFWHPDTLLPFLTLCLWCQLALLGASLIRHDPLALRGATLIRHDPLALLSARRSLDDLPRGEQERRWGRRRIAGGGVPLVTPDRLPELCQSWGGGFPY